MSARPYRFQNVHGVVLASAARLGLVGPLGGQELITSERFFAGGSRTVRGVDENSLGPIDFFGDPAGGASMLVLNQEARVPVYKWLSGVGFMDAGNVYATIPDLKLSDLVGSVGFGVRLNTPFALLRADYGGSCGDRRRGRASGSLGSARLSNAVMRVGASGAIGAIGAKGGVHGTSRTDCTLRTSRTDRLIDLERSS